MNDADAFRGYSQNFAGNLSHDGIRTLTHVDGAAKNTAASVTVDIHLGHGTGVGTADAVVADQDFTVLLVDGDTDGVRAAYGAVRAMLDVLGLSPADFAGASGGDDKLRTAVDQLVPAMLDARQAARERKDFAEADRIRDALADAGVVVEDTAAGPRWRVG